MQIATNSSKCSLTGRMVVLVVNAAADTVMAADQTAVAIGGVLDRWRIIVVHVFHR